MQIAMRGATDIGQLRRVNEDSFGLIPQCNTVVVCDGMGGHAAGEVASNRAVETVEAYLLRRNGLPQLGTPDDETPAIPADAAALVWAVRLANRRVYQIAQSQQQMMGMGTTLVAAQFSTGAVTVCHVGDSRAYRFRGGQLVPVTTDHSLVAELLSRNEITPEQARTFSERNIITRALGTRPSVAVDVSVMPAVTGDWYMLCSDGLCGVIADDEISAILAAHDSDPEQAIRALIAAANDAGGPDNVTVAIAVIVESGEAPDTVTQEQTKTIPESSEDAAQSEAAFLEKLFPSAEPAEKSLDDADTDRIPISRR